MNILLEEKIEEDENIADGFKMLVSEESNSISVFPKFFIVKIAGLVFITSAVIAIFACVSFYVFPEHTNRAIKCLYTIHYSSVRMMLLSFLLHGVHANGADIPIDTLKSFLNELIDVNSAILYLTSSYNLSNDALSENKVHSAQFDYHCDNTSDLACRNIIELVDLYINEISNIPSYLSTPTSAKMIRDNGINADLARNIFNDNLVNKSVSLTETIYDYTVSMMNNSLIIEILLLVIPILALIVLLVFVVKTIFNELSATIQSVKLPLKYINPTDLPDMPRMMQYLQGECDWNRGVLNEKSSEEKSGNSILNTLHCSPFLKINWHFYLQILRFIRC